MASTNDFPNWLLKTLLTGDNTDLVAVFTLLVSEMMLLTFEHRFSRKSTYQGTSVAIYYTL